MPFRSAGYVALATGLVLPIGRGAPTTTKYRIDQSLTQEIDATVAGGAKQRIAFSTSSFVTVVLADSAGGKAIKLVVDSVRGDSATPIPATVLDSARGTEFRGFVEKSGRPTGLKPATNIPAATQIQGLLPLGCRGMDASVARRYPQNSRRRESRVIPLRRSIP